jgi:hypothetical protein
MDSSISFLGSDFGVRRSPFAVHRSAFAVQLSVVFVSTSSVTTFNFLVMILLVMDDFTQFDAFDRCREFAQFVSIAKGSVGEARGQLIYALDFGYLKPEMFSDLDRLGKTATQCLGGLIRYLNDSSFRGRKFKQRDDVRNKARPRKRPRGTSNAERRTLNAEP